MKAGILVKSYTEKILGKKLFWEGSDYKKCKLHNIKTNIGAFVQINDICN